MDRANHYRVLRRSAPPHEQRDLFDGILGNDPSGGQRNGSPSGGNNPAFNPLDPFGLGGAASSILAPVFSPINSALQPSQSASDTISLTGASSSTTPVATSTPATSSATSSSATTSTSSSSLSSSSSSAAPSSLTDPATSTGSSVTQSAASQPSSDGASPLPTPPPTSSNSDLTTFTTSTVTSSSGATPSTSHAKSTSSFFENKPLSIGVLTAASIVVLILVVAIGTYAVRRRRRSRLDADDEFTVSTFDLVAEHHGAEDMEKTGALPPMERSGSRGTGESSGSGASGSINRGPVRPAYEATPTWMPPAPREMYERTGYPALFVPVQGQTQRGVQRPAPPTGMGGPYAQDNGPQRRPSNGRRKKPPTLSQLTVPAPVPAASAPSPREPSPMTAVSLSSPPMQPAKDMNAANPYAELVYQTQLPQSAPSPRRSSLLPSRKPSPTNGAAASSPPKASLGAQVPAAEEGAARRFVIRNE